MKVQSLFNHPIIPLTNPLHTVEIIIIKKKQFHIQTFALFRDSLGTPAVHRICLSHKRPPTVTFAAYQCRMVSRPEKGERRGENLPEENKRKALEMEGGTVRLQFWMHRRPGEKGEQWSFRTCPSLRVALFAVSFFFLLSTQGQRSFERISGDRADRRQTHSTPPQTPFKRQEGSVNKCVGTHVSAALPSFTLFQGFRSRSTFEYHGCSTFAPHLRKGLPYFPLMWQ